MLAEKDHWEQDLTQAPVLVQQVANDLDAILEKGMREAVRPFVLIRNLVRPGFLFHYISYNIL